MQTKSHGSQLKYIRCWKSWGQNKSTSWRSSQNARSNLPCGIPLANRDYAPKNSTITLPTQDIEIWQGKQAIAQYKIPLCDYNTDASSPTHPSTSKHTLRNSTLIQQWKPALCQTTWYYNNRSPLSVRKTLARLSPCNTVHAFKTPRLWTTVIDKNQQQRSYFFPH